MYKSKYLKRYPQKRAYNRHREYEHPVAGYLISDTGRLSFGYSQPSRLKYAEPALHFIRMLAQYPFYHIHFFIASRIFKSQNQNSCMGFTRSIYKLAEVLIHGDNHA